MMSEFDDMPELCTEEDDAAIDSDEDEDKWIEIKEDEDNIICLFCDSSAKNFDRALEHLTTKHNFNLSNIKQKFEMDEYSFIKMINYIRLQKLTAEQFIRIDTMLWHDNIYLKPVLDNDVWLMFDFDDLKATVNEEGDCKDIVVSAAQYNNFHKIIRDLNAQLKEKDDVIEQATANIETMKKSFQNLLDDQEKIGETSKVSAGLNECVANVSLEDDEGYFNTYAHYGIHHDMLSDEVRTTSYKNAILKNSEIMKDKLVLDIGCGTSILSMFASQAGAKQIIAIDQSDIIYHAMDIVRRNNISNITFIKGRLENTEIPVEKFDVIISEWMGYFLLFEGMLDSIIFARDRYLKPGGLLLPNQCNISLVGFGDVSKHNGLIEYWGNVYGFDMSTLKDEVVKEAAIENCNPDFILTTSNVIADFNLMTVDIKCSNFTYDFSMDVLKAGKLTSLVGYFDVFFNLPSKVEFSTSPKSKPTHWKQVVFYFKDMIDVKVGDCIKGKFTCMRDRKDVRALIVTIEMFDKIYKYNLN